MWGKVSFHRSKKSSIGDPTPENNNDNYFYNKPSGHNSVYQTQSLSGSSSSALSVGDRYYSKDLTALPKDSAPAGKRPDSKPRSASATLTRTPVQAPRHRANSAVSPSTNFVRNPNNKNHNKNSSSSNNYRYQSPDISPPGTPASGPDSRGSSQISPIEEEPYDTKEGQMEARFASHRLTSHKDARKENSRPLPDIPNSEQSPRPSAHSRTTRWDDFSGEPSTSGKTGQVAPGSAPFASQASSKPAGNHSSRVFSWGKEHLQSKKRLAEVRSRASKQNEEVLLAAARGPSGRTPMMDPIHEPREMSSSQSQPSKSSDRPRGPDDAPPDTTSRLRPSVVTTITASQDKPGGPKKYPADRNRAPSAGANPRPSVSASRNNNAPPRIDLPEPDLHSPLADLKLGTAPDATSQLDQAQLPVSRPRTATDASDTRASSPGSLAESIDPVTQSEEYRASVMARKRPVPSGIAPGKKPVRKPTPTQAANDATSKGLYLCPPEQQPKDRVEALEERQRTLARRNTNITTIIHELNQVFQPTSAAYDITAREEVKKTLGGLNNELSEIKREEHEIGVKLLRVWKKRDAQDLYGGGTGLWVKRVTS